MSFASSTNRWASRVVIVLQLTTWSAVSVVLLQKGASSLQRRMLGTSTDHVIEPQTQSGNQETNRIDHLEDKNTSRILRIIRDKERILDDGSSRSVGDLEFSEPVSRDEENTGNVTERKTEFARNASTMQRSPSIHGRSGEPIASTAARSKSRTSFPRISDGGATTAIAMVVIGAIMLLLAPTVIILRILDERKQARTLLASSVTASEDLPPTYEQVVFLSEAPRYSTLSLNDDYSSPPSASSAAASLIKSDSM